MIDRKLDIGEGRSELLVETAEKGVVSALFLAAFGPLTAGALALILGDRMQNPEMVSFGHSALDSQLKIYAAAAGVISLAKLQKGAQSLPERMRELTQWGRVIL